MILLCQIAWIHFMSSLQAPVSQREFNKKNSNIHQCISPFLSLKIWLSKIGRYQTIKCTLFLTWIVQIKTHIHYNAVLKVLHTTRNKIATWHELLKNGSFYLMTTFCASWLCFGQPGGYDNLMKVSRGKVSFRRMSQDLKQRFPWFGHTQVFWIFN